MVLLADGAGVFVPGVQLQADKTAAKGAKAGAKAGAKSAEKAAAKKEKEPAKAAAKKGRPKKVRMLVVVCGGACVVGGVWRAWCGVCKAWAASRGPVSHPQQKGVVTPFFFTLNRQPHTVQVPCTCTTAPLPLVTGAMSLSTAPPASLPPPCCTCHTGPQGGE